MSTQDDVDDFVGKLRRFKQSFPQHQNYTTYGAVAGIEINDGVDSYAYRQGLFVIRPSGDTVAMVNDANFQPTAWEPVRYIRIIIPLIPQEFLTFC